MSKDYNNYDRVILITPLFKFLPGSFNFSGTLMTVKKIN